MPGMDLPLVDTLDFKLSLGRIRTDVLRDFILAPHYSAVFVHVADDLIDKVKRQLKSGEYTAGIPIKVDVPKANGISRPGAILNPIDRTVYQILVDTIGPHAESQLDRSRVFSNVLLDEDPDYQMFKSHDECWQNMKAALLAKCDDTNCPIVLKTDIASYFERIYQHNLINLLRSSGCDSRVVNLLEELLLEFTGRNSHGILQGMFPSDFLGNFYLASLDDGLRAREIPSVRYVDDLYLFFPNELDARKGLIDLCRILRCEGLNLNESKTKILKSDDLIEEETEIDRLFTNAKQEIRETELPISVESQYGFQVVWLPGEEVLEPVEVELQAVEDLYNEGVQDEHLIEKVERFCLPYLGSIGNMTAVDNSLSNISRYPHLSRVYCNYLLYFIKDSTDITQQLESVVASSEIPYDWSLIWPIATLIEAHNVSSETVDKAIQIIDDAGRLEALRSTAVYLVAKHGSAGQRRILRHRYDSEPSVFVREAILFASKYFPPNERKNCIRAWGGHSFMNSLIAKAVRISSSSSHGS